MCHFLGCTPVHSAGGLCRRSGRLPRPTCSVAAWSAARPRRCHYLLLLDDADAGLDVGEGVHGGEDRVPPVLLMQLPTRPPLQGEGGGVHEPPQIEILLKVGYPVFHLILIKVRLHKSDLYVSLRGKRQGKEKMSYSQITTQDAPEGHAGTSAAAPPLPVH